MENIFFFWFDEEIVLVSGLSFRDEIEYDIYKRFLGRFEIIVV